MNRRRKKIVKGGRKAAIAAILCALLLGGCGKEPAAEDVSVTEMSGKEQLLESAQPSEEQQISEENQPSAEETMPEENQPDAGEAVTWEATVETVGTNSFIVSEVFTDVMDDGSMIAVAPIGDTERKMIEVSYTDQTIFTIRTTYNSGTSYSDSAGTDADLEEMASCVLTGIWEGDVFHASEVLIYNHQ